MAKEFERNRPDTMKSDMEIILEGAFPTMNRHQLLQTMTELSTRSITPFAVLGVLRRKYKSRILSMFQEEYNLNRIAHDRKGRLEYIEVAASVRAEEKEHTGEGT